MGRHLSTIRKNYDIRKMVNAQLNIQTLPPISAIKVEISELRLIFIPYRKRVTIKVETATVSRHV